MQSPPPTIIHPQTRKYDTAARELQVTVDVYGVFTVGQSPIEYYSGESGKRSKMIIVLNKPYGKVITGSSGDNKRIHRSAFCRLGAKEDAMVPMNL
ncbi:hypothetical protein PoB_004335200 [Plakobranchus ocellatus]|uniref:Uncharacterized protein n=1 Tax=Plakobranchus ocellatus TaxID=259542 RepID=A0AAV4BD16_9GAST|nr:hypothetical protein PoB_004335200 [Plakobranchus ocellatus]